MSEKREVQRFHSDLVTRQNEGQDLCHWNGLSLKKERPSLLLHSCCGPCSTSVIEQLCREYHITVFFYNPCITEEEEYLRRKETQLSFIRDHNENVPAEDRIDFREGPYDPKNFYRMTDGLEEEPEGGKRCKICFEQRLEKTAETARMLGCDYFATTLTVSPHKNYTMISNIGKRLAAKYRLSFLDRDFKKKAGFQRSIELSKEHGLYRQNYCGCQYSKR